MLSRILKIILIKSLVVNHIGIRGSSLLNPQRDMNLRKKSILSSRLKTTNMTIRIRPQEVEEATKAKLLVVAGTI